MKQKIAKTKNLWRIFVNSFVYNNAILTGAMGMCCVISAGITLKNAIALSFLLIFMFIPLSVIAPLFLNKLPEYLKVPIIVLISTLIFCPVCYLLLPKLLITMPQALGIYAPIMVVNSIIITKSLRYSNGKYNWLETLVNACGTVCGFVVVIYLMSAIRELLIYGTLWEKVVFENYTPIISISYPFVGFIILGFFSAFVKSLRINKEKRENKNKRLNSRK